MSRINYENLALSSDQARAARNYFGWPQAKAAEECGLPLHKIKRFESGNYIPDAEFLEALRAFYEKRGYQFEDTPVPGDSAKRNGQVFPGGVVGDIEAPAAEAKNYRERTGAAKVHHMRIALQDEGEMGRALDLIEENEERVAELLRSPSIRALARALGVCPRTVRRWMERGVAPRPAMLAVFWLTRWGMSVVDAEAVNAARLHIGMANSLKRRVEELEDELDRLGRIGDFGAANDPSPSVRRQVPRLPMVGGPGETQQAEEAATKSRRTNKKAPARKKTPSQLRAELARQRLESRAEGPQKPFDFLRHG